MNRCYRLYSRHLYHSMHGYIIYLYLTKDLNFTGQQIREAMYGNEIAYNVDKLMLSNIYLILAAQVRVSRKSYSRSIHTFYWIIDKETIVKFINPNDELEKPLPPPTKLNVTPLGNIAQLIPAPSTEIGILFFLNVVLLNLYACKYTW